MSAILSFGGEPDPVAATGPGPGTNSNPVPTEVDASKVVPDEAALLAIQQMRDAAEAAANRHADVLAARLNQMEQAMAAHREREFVAMQKANRGVLVAITVLVTLGLIGTALMTIFMFRSVHRLAEMAMGFPERPFPGGAPLASQGDKDPLLAWPTELEQSTEMVLGAIGKLQQRIDQIETTATPSLPAVSNGRAETTSTSSAAPPVEAVATQPLRGRAEAIDRVSLLFDKGNAHLNLDQAAAAMQCFDELIALQPDHAEAHIKRGAALEKLERFEEALASYDRALGLDSGLATAHLCKGGVFHRLERYDEALRCYEEALRVGRAPDED